MSGAYHLHAIRLIEIDSVHSADHVFDVALEHSRVEAAAAKRLLQYRIAANALLAKRRWRKRDLSLPTGKQPQTDRPPRYTSPLSRRISSIYCGSIDEARCLCKGQDCGADCLEHNRERRM